MMMMMSRHDKEQYTLLNYSVMSESPAKLRHTDWEHDPRLFV